MESNAKCLVLNTAIITCVMLLMAHVQLVNQDSMETNAGLPAPTIVRTNHVMPRMVHA